MSFSLPNLDYQRWPALDEHGQFELANGVRRPRRRSPHLVDRIDGGPHAMDHEGDVLCAGDESPGGHRINGRWPETLDGWELHIVQQPFIELMTHFWSRPPEAGGVLFGPVDDPRLVTRFLPDHLGRGTPATFELHTASLNPMIQELKAAGLTCKGVVHSHPAGVRQPSARDEVYFRRLFACPANRATTHIFVPIVCGGRLYPYVFQGERVVPATLVVV